MKDHIPAAQTMYGEGTSCNSNDKEHWKYTKNGSEGKRSRLV